MEFFKEVLPRIIVTHNLYETETKLMTNEEVTDFIYEKLELTSKVVGEYTSYMFRPNGAGTEGNKDHSEDAVSKAV